MIDPQQPFDAKLGDYEEYEPNYFGAILDDSEEYDSLTNPEGDDAAAESNSTLSDVFEVNANSTDATTAMPTRDDEERAGADREQADVEYCESQIDFLTLFGGILIGATLTVLVQCCCLAYRKKSPADSYSVPYKFDEFVNP